MDFFVKNLLIEGQSPYAIFTKFGMAGPHHYAKLYRCGFENVGLQPSKSPKLVIFGINFSLRENPGVHRKT